MSKVLVRFREINDGFMIYLTLLSLFVVLFMFLVLFVCSFLLVFNSFEYLIGLKEYVIHLKVN